MEGVSKLKTKRKTQPILSPLETMKILTLANDAMVKISKVAETLFRNNDSKNALLLLQAWNDIMQIHAKLEGKARTITKQYGETTLEKIKDAVMENGGL